MAFLSVVLVAVDNSSNTTTISLNPSDIIEIRPASAEEILQYPTAVTTIEYKDLVYQSPVKRKAYTATATATVLASVAAAQTGVLGSGASGQTTLIAGTKAITIAGLTTRSIALVSLVSSLTGSLTVTYQAVCTDNTLTLQANVAAGTINVNDVSVLNWAIVG